MRARPVDPGTTRLLRRLDFLRFDGNLTDDMRSWLFPDADFQALSPESLDHLMGMTVADGNLAWVIIPPAGYRL